MRRGRVTKRSTRDVNTRTLSHTHTHTHTGKWVERTLGETNERELKKSQSTLDSSPLSEECERGSWMERLLLKRCKKKKKKKKSKPRRATVRFQLICISDEERWREREGARCDEGRWREARRKKRRGKRSDGDGVKARLVANREREKDYQQAGIRPGRLTRGGRHSEKTWSEEFSPL